VIVAAALVATMLPVRPAAAANWYGWESLNGVLTDGTGIAATSWGNNRIDLFVNGTDGAIWHKWWDGRAWRGWESLGGCSPATPTAVSTDPGRVDVFVVGCGASTPPLYRKSWDGSRWSDWQSEGGAYLAGLAATTFHNGRWDVFTISPQNRLNHVWFDGQRHTEELYLKNDSISALAAASWGPGHIDVFAINRGIMQRRTWDNSTGWSQQWETVDEIANRGIGAVSWGPGRIDTFERGNNTDVNDGTVWHKWFEGGTWNSGRESQGGVALTGPIGASSWSSGRLDVFVAGTDHAVWHKWYG
jgi:hypothetical protein